MAARQQAKKKNIRQDEETALQAAPESALVAEVDDSAMWADADQGHEEVGAEDLRIPTLVILQKMSPQVDPDQDGYVDGAKIGHLCNTLTGELYDVSDEPLELICCYFRRTVTIMADDGTSQGAYVANVQLDDPMALRKTERREVGGKKRDCFIEAPDQYRIDVAEHYVMFPETLQPILIRMKVSSMGASKNLNSRLKTFEMLRHPDTGEQRSRPRYGIVTGFSTQREQNREGKPYLRWDASPVGVVSSTSVYNAAKAFCEAVSKGHVVTESDEPAQNQDTEIPF